MYGRSSSLILRWLKVPPEPHPPVGDPASLRVFRAGKNYFNLRLAGWFFAQVIALAGIIFWLVVFLQVETAIDARHRAGRTATAPASVKDFEEYLKKIGDEEKPATPAAAENPNPASPAAPGAVAAASPEVKNDQGKPSEAPKKKRTRARITGWAGFKQIFVELGMLLPAWSFPLIWGLKIFGILVYLIQLPLTYAVRRLDYEMRWYMVTDRSLRIRHGVWKIQESTMSFANIQQVVVSQNPVQQLLGLANVRVQSAGGGGGHDERHQADDDMHTGMFHGVTNAQEIRDLILERLKHFRESGLGDPEELRRAALVSAVAAAPVAANLVSTSASPELLAAARELASEAKALRVALG